MPKCLECGFVAPRLQWTHFKYKCTGRFNNGTEYKKAYPGAEILDDDMRQFARITPENLIRKYGEIEGQLRYDEYCKKQAYSNSLEYKKEKHGWDEETYDKFNKSRAVTLSNLVKKHGEKIGVEKWEAYCHRQAYTNTLEYFIEKLGEVEGTAKYKEIGLAKAVHQVQYSLSSNVERQFILDLQEVLGFDLEYTIFTTQYLIRANDKINLYDIVHNKRAIEFNGDYWHCNPLVYEANYFHPQYQMLAEEVWNKDRLKISALEQDCGIETLVIWEIDYYSNKNDVLNRCKEWILNGKK